MINILHSTTKTAADGLGNNIVYGMYIPGHIIYVCITNGFLISTTADNKLHNYMTDDNLIKLYTVYWF